MPSYLYLVDSTVDSNHSITKILYLFLRAITIKYYIRILVYNVTIKTTCTYVYSFITSLLTCIIVDS